MDQAVQLSSRLFDNVSQLFKKTTMKCNYDVTTLPAEIVVEILLRLPCNEAVLCSQTCKRWYNAVNNYSFWIRKCKYDKYLDEPSSLAQFQRVPLHNLKRCIAKRAFNRNLIEDDYTGARCILDTRWHSDNQRRGQTRNRSSFVQEYPPIFFDGFRRSDLDSNDIPIASCLVSSYTIAQRRICIDLSLYGITDELIQNLKPTIVVREFYSNRADCSCLYLMRSWLTNKLIHNGESMPQTLPQTTEVEIEQWAEQYWRKAEHIYKEYGNDRTSVMIIDTQGRDRQFWDGYYGVKVAGIQLKVMFEFNG